MTTTEDQVDWTQVEQFLGFVWRLCLRHAGSVTSGCRTSARNLLKGGHAKSKHTFTGGWGMACDLMFDRAESREPAIEECRAAGYHPVVQEHYHPAQLHVQGWAYGRLPTWLVQKETPS